MNKFRSYRPLLWLWLIAFTSCQTANISKYYAQNRDALDGIAHTYRDQNRSHHFSILFPDKSFKNVTVEILTDSIRYIYEFAVSENRMKDTLEKYGLDVQGTQALIRNMQSIHCTWIDNLDYYADAKKDNLIYMSIRTKAFNWPLMDKKYFILTYYSQPQYYDQDGRLLDRKARKRLRRINNEIFRRINDSVCYTISGIFR